MYLVFSKCVSGNPFPMELVPPPPPPYTPPGVLGFIKHIAGNAISRILFAHPAHVKLSHTYLFHPYSHPVKGGGGSLLKFPCLQIIKTFSN